MNDYSVVLDYDQAEELTIHFLQDMAEGIKETGDDPDGYLVDAIDVILADLVPVQNWRV